MPPRRKTPDKRQRFTAEEFNRGIAGRQFDKTSIRIARAVLVNNRPVATVADDNGVSRQWAYSVIKRIRERILGEVSLPTGWIVGEVTLPKERWKEVRRLEQEARAALKKK